MREPTPRALIVLATMALASGRLVSTVHAADDLPACRRALGSETTRFLRKAATVLRKCADRRLTLPTITCPQPADEAQLGRARARAEVRVEGACAAALPPELSGPCPGPCGIDVTDAANLADCYLCVAEQAVESFIGAVFPAPGRICGDGVIAAGEACDPPDDDACPGRCGLPATPGACQCAAVTSCTEVLQPPGSCTTGSDCPPGYLCAAGRCEAGTCVTAAECPAEGQCMHPGSAPTGTCVCRGCGPQDCPLGCTVGGVITGCICNSIDDCPPEDDVCFQGVCS
jgi:hypothetical protein